jgi:hypothetical protein
MEFNALLVFSIYENSFSPICVTNLTGNVSYVPRFCTVPPLKSVTILRLFTQYTSYTSPSCIHNSTLHFSSCIHNQPVTLLRLLYTNRQVHFSILCTQPASYTSPSCVHNPWVTLLRLPSCVHNPPGTLLRLMYITHKVHFSVLCI